MFYGTNAYPLSAALLIGLAGYSQAASKLNVITSTQDIASIAAEVGGDRITVESIAKGYQDPHFVEPKPSFLLKLQKADLLAVVGLQLEIGWLPPLITQSRNSKIQEGNPGISRYVSVLPGAGDSHYSSDEGHGRRAPAGQSPLLVGS